MAKSLDGWFKDIIIKEKRRQMKNGVASQVSQNEAIRTGIKRVPGLSEVTAQADALNKKPLHHYVFCTHNVPYWRTCTKCGRDKQNAKRNGEMILKGTQTLNKS